MMYLRNNRNTISKRLMVVLALSIGLLQVQEVYAASQVQNSQLKSARVESKEKKSSVGSQKRLSLKQKISRQYKEVKKYISENKIECCIWSVAFLGSVILGRCLGNYLNKSHKDNMATQDTFVSDYLRMQERQWQERELQRQERDAPYKEYRRNMRLRAEEEYQLAERVQGRILNPAAVFGHRANYPMHHPRGFIADFNQPLSDYRDRIFRQALFYGNETREQYENARGRINHFSIALRQQGIPRDLRVYHLVPALPDAIAAIGFWHLRYNRHLIRQMPAQAQAALIDAMANRHLENLELIVAEMRNQPNPLDDYQLPTRDEVRQIMEQRIQAIVNAPQQGAGHDPQDEQENL